MMMKTRSTTKSSRQNMPKSSKNIHNNKEKLSPRLRLANFSTLDDVVKCIRKARSILVVTGAGVSVSCGIPDFRSKDVGLYNNLDCQKIGIPSAELLFDYEFFKIDPQPFYKFCSFLLPNNIQPSTTHRFIAMLEQKKKLLRNYTQNVDGIERRMGIENIFECHGTMKDFSCMNKKCSRKKKSLDSVLDEVRLGEVCYCPCGDVLKPNITFFGESLPPAFITALEKDISKCDLVLVVGTSLKVGGSVYELLKRLDRRVPQVLINREAVQPPASISDGFDVSLLGDCDDIFRMICSRLRWDLKKSATTAPKLKLKMKVNVKVIQKKKKKMKTTTTIVCDVAAKGPLQKRSRADSESDEEIPECDHVEAISNKRQRNTVAEDTQQSAARNRSSSRSALCAVSSTTTSSSSSSSSSSSFFITPFNADSNDHGNKKVPSFRAGSSAAKLLFKKLEDRMFSVVY